MQLQFVTDVTQSEFHAANANLFFRAWTPSAVLFSFLSKTLLFTAIGFAAVGPSGAGFSKDVLAPLALGVVVAAVVMTVSFATCWLQLPSQSNRQYALTGTMELPTHYDLTAASFKASYGEGTSVHPWSRFLDYVDDKQVLLLRRTLGFMFVIPKRSLTPQQLQDFHTLLSEVGVKRS